MRRVGKALLPHDEYVASLPRKRMAVAALIRDASDRALLVSPIYEGSWLVPGGVVDAGESPHAVCRREVAEETGLSLPQGRILAVDWTPQDLYLIAHHEVTGKPFMGKWFARGGLAPYPHAPRPA